MQFNYECWVMKTKKVTIYLNFAITFLSKFFTAVSYRFQTKKKSIELSFENIKNKVIKKSNWSFCMNILRWVMTNFFYTFSFWSWFQKKCQKIGLVYQLIYPSKNFSRLIYLAKVSLANPKKKCWKSVEGQHILNK